MLLVVILACSTVQNLSIPGQRSSPEVIVPTFTLLPTATKTPQPTPTPLPTPTPPPAVRIHNGENALLNGDWDSALQQFSAAFEPGGDPEIQSAAILGQARTNIAAKNYEAAIVDLDSLLENYPDSPQLPYAYFALAQAYSALDRHSEAADAHLNYLIIKPGVVDAYILDLRGDALSSANRHGEALIDYRAALVSPGYLEPIQIQMKIANAHAILGDYETALGVYEQIYNQTQSDQTKARVDLLMGQIYTALGQLESAYQRYLDAVNNFPTAYDSYLALINLVEAGVPVDDLDRGIVDYYAGQYGVARAAFDRYFQVNGIEQATARYYNGLTLRALGLYQAALDEWDKLIINFPEDRLWDQAWEQKAYTQWFFIGDYNAAIETLLDFTNTDPTHPRSGEFLYDAAVIAERGDLLLRAIEIWGRVAEEYPTYENAQRALFLAGITRYRLNDYTGALAIFQRYLENATTSTERTAAYFWQGKSQSALGDFAAANTTWELTANIDPTGYYSERARDILRQLDPFTPPDQYDLSVDLQTERDQANAWMVNAFSLDDTTDFSSSWIYSDTRLLRGTELWNLGLKERARIEFEDLRLAVQSDPLACYQLTNYLYEIGLYRSAILAARQVLNLAGMSDAGTLSAPVYFNHIRFGTYYSDLLIPSAQNNGLHPLFLFSVMRQESAFEGFVSSSAGARGLMQIIPSTGEEIANRLGWPPNYSADDLYRPNVSLAFGADYLATWRDYFDSDLYLALAAYNGGPGNAIEWQKLASDDPDLFLEVIRYEETRNYLRSIYEIFNIYRRIYQRTN